MKMDMHDLRALIRRESILTDEIKTLNSKLDQLLGELDSVREAIAQAKVEETIIDSDDEECDFEFWKH